ncbi:MAG: RNA polymerase sigma factor [Nitrospiraceae bacterium]
MNVDTFTVTESMRHRIGAGRKPELSQSATVANGEVALLARLRQGDEGAFDELVTQHHSALIRMAMGYVADREVAEEVVQDTWMAVIEGLGRFEGRSSLRTWIFGIMIHKAKDRGVREKRHTTFSSFESVDDNSDETVDPSRFHQSGEWAVHWAFPPQPWDDQTPEKLLASQQAVTAMNKAIEALPRNLKDVLILRDVEGVEAKEVSHILKITETNLYVRLHRARERVRQAVETYLEGHPLPCKKMPEGPTQS